MAIDEIGYRAYGLLQNAYHLLRSGGSKAKDEILYAYHYDEKAMRDLFRTVTALNGEPAQAGDICQRALFKGDNYAEGVHPDCRAEKSPIGIRMEKDAAPEALWLAGIRAAKVEPGWKNQGFYLTAYIRERGEWALSNWIWTSAATARALSRLGHKEEAAAVADAFLAAQLPCGGWIVRYDRLGGRWVRLAAPNDSAYVAANSLLVSYEDTGDLKYLRAAEQCARWIMETAAPDGLVPFGLDVDRDKWISEKNIVDIGFTACLFAVLFRATGEDQYRAYMEKFINAYVGAFYDEAAKLFATHINGEKKQNGGYFSRGQAWALEGLISAWEISRSDRLRGIIEAVTGEIAAHQLPNGGWPCNFQKARALMGEDCKGIACIGKALAVWAAHSDSREKLMASAGKALAWCAAHTDRETGTIVSFTCNGAIAHSMNTSTGMLYANAYALELSDLLNGKA